MENERDKNTKEEVKKLHAGSVPVENINLSSECICKIVIDLKDLKDKVLATGFFIDIYPSFKCLITNFHVISQDMVNSNTVIKILDHKGLEERLKLNKDDRYIKCFDRPIDITVIQIKMSDKINKKFKSLTPDLNYQYGYQIYNHEDIFMLQYPLGGQLKSASGKITDFDKIFTHNFYHNIDTDEGSSGSPIILNSNFKVIGVHVGAPEDKDISENYATFLGSIFNEINKDIELGLINDIKMISNINNIKDDDIKRPNYIVAEINIDSKNINKDILILNSYEESKRRAKISFLEENLKNEKEIKEFEIKINDQKINFSYVHNFKKVGRYTIYYEFKNKLTNCNHMFSDCSLLGSIDIGKLDTENIIDVSYMFAYCTSLINIDLSFCNFKNVTNMEGTFYGCTSLKNINLKKIQTQEIKNLSWAFYRCSSLNEIDLSDFETNNVVNMNSMLAECSSLVNINLKYFEAKNAKNMSTMFGSCTLIKNLDLSYLEPQNVTYMDRMFFNCISLSNLNMEKFITKNDCNLINIFYGCHSLKKENLVCHDKNIIEQIPQKTN